MMHNDDAFVTMLLMSQINPSRDELVRPLSAAEWHKLNIAVRQSNLISMAGLLKADMSQIMLSLNCTEDEAYRLCVLLGRTLPLSISIETLKAKEIELLTYDEQSYPETLREMLGAKAPPMLYVSGRPELFKQPAIAILGALAPRGNTEERIRALTSQACKQGYVIVSDGQNGLGSIALDQAIQDNGRAILVLAGAMADAVLRPQIKELLKQRRIVLISQFHPDAPVTTSHANARNKCVYALSQSAFVFGCDENKGTTWEGAREALRSRSCKFIYVLDTELYSGNRALIQRGAIPIPSLNSDSFPQLAGLWRSASAEQTCLFDWDNPRRP